MCKHKMSIVGQNINLEVIRSTEIGLFLDTENRQFNGILLPSRYVPNGVEVGDFIDVFIYNNINSYVYLYILALGDV